MEDVKTAMEASEQSAATAKQAEEEAAAAKESHTVLLASRVEKMHL